MANSITEHVSSDCERLLVFIISYASYDGLNKKGISVNLFGFSIVVWPPNVTRRALVCRWAVSVILKQHKFKRSTKTSIRICYHYPTVAACTEGSNHITGDNHVKRSGIQRMEKLHRIVYYKSPLLFSTNSAIMANAKIVPPRRGYSRRTRVPHHWRNLAAPPNEPAYL